MAKFGLRPFVYFVVSWLLFFSVDRGTANRSPSLQLVDTVSAVLKVYTLSNCSTCRDATKWLRAVGIEFEEIPIRERPPTITEITAMFRALGDSRRAFNTSGREYREQKLSEKLPLLSDVARAKLLAGNGSLVKRPFAIGAGIAIVGFDQAQWKAAFGR